MVMSLKSTVALLAKKYSWHTLGESVLPGIRNSCTVINDGIQNRAVNKKIDIEPAPSSTRKKRTQGPKTTKTSSTVLLPHGLHHLVVKFKPNTKSKKLIAEREDLTQEIYREYNEMAFEGMLPPDLEISWSKRLTSTAGITRMSSQTRGVKKVRSACSKEVDIGGTCHMTNIFDALIYLMSPIIF